MRYFGYSIGRAKVIVGIVISAVLLFAAGDGSAQSSDPEQAFRAFLSDANYGDADFYIKNDLIDPAELDTGQIFFDVLMDKYASNIAGNARQIDKLYTYLNGLHRVELNRPVSCQVNYTAGICFIGNSILTGGPISFARYLVERGLDLNYQGEGMVSATVPLLVRLGTVYSVGDLTALTKMGLVIGDESYPVTVLSQYQDPYLYQSQLEIPGEYTASDDFNLLDFAVIALGSKISTYGAANASHDDSLCRFVAYAAPSYRPSFDYLQYLLKAKQNFRGSLIGKTERSDRTTYQTFPSSCVSLIQSMAASHAQLAEVASRFAVEKDVATARWLMSLKKPAPAAAKPKK